MTIRLLIDMNLSPKWVEVLRRHGWEVEHWSTVGRPSAPDREIMDWARGNGYVVLTHDLDFGALLALTNADGPSVIQVRAQDVFPEQLEALLMASLRQHAALLEAGALVVVDESSSRARVLPLTARGSGT